MRRVWSWKQIENMYMYPYFSILVMFRREKSGEYLWKIFKFFSGVLAENEIVKDILLV